MANPLVFDCTSCQAQQQVQDTVLTARGTGRLGGRFLILEIDRLSLGVRNQIVRRPVTFARTPNSPLLEPVFVIAQQPGHWICFARHRMNNSWFRMNDSANPVPGDPFQGGNFLVNYVVFSVNWEGYCRGSSESHETRIFRRWKEHIEISLVVINNVTVYRIKIWFSWNGFSHCPQFSGEFAMTTEQYLFILLSI